MSTAGDMMHPQNQGESIPSIERTCPGRPGHASHVKRYAMSSRIPVLLCILLVWPAFRVQSAERVLSEEKACSILRARMAVHDGVPSARAQSTWFCDGYTN